MSKLSIHPAAELFPLLEGDELDALVEDIKTNGLHEAITLLDGQVLDGRNRLTACEKAGIEPVFCEADSKTTDPINFVLSLNLHRRHLTVGQRSMIGAKIAKNVHGGARNFKFSPTNLKSELSLKQAAELVDVHPSSISRARTINDYAEDDMVKGVLSGKVKLETAYHDALNNKRKAKKPTIVTSAIDPILDKLNKGERRTLATYIDSLLLGTRIEASKAATEAEKRALDEQAELQTARQTLDADRKIVKLPMTKAEFRLIIGMLHPDVHPTKEERARKAFDIFNRLKRFCK